MNIQTVTFTKQYGVCVTPRQSSCILHIHSIIWGARMQIWGQDSFPKRFYFGCCIFTLITKHDTEFYAFLYQLSDILTQQQWVHSNMVS